MSNIACEKCGGALFVDREAVLQVTRRSFRGGRIFCVAGCTDVWLIEPARAMTGRAMKPPDGRGKYSRTVRTVSCRVCERPYQSRGTRRGRCKACRAEAQRTRDRLRRASHHAGEWPSGGGETPNILSQASKCSFVPDGGEPIP